MRLGNPFAILHRPFRLPSRTIRLRLTVLYASLFLVSGAGLLAVTYVLVREATDDVLVGTGSDGSAFAINESDGTRSGSPGTSTGAEPTIEQRVDGRPGRKLTPQQLQAQLEREQDLAERQHAAELRHLLEQSGIALAIMAAASIGLGWFAAGRVLRPLRTINERTRAISASNLHKRLALAGPDDELTQLASTFDDLLGRLEASFQAHRQFVANASHELRTPLARAQTLAEVALADPEATVDSLRASHQRVLASGQQQERLIEALLTLARSEGGIEHREPFDLAAVTEAVLTARRLEARRRGLDVHATLEAAESCGDPRLAERLVANLIDNALRHNRAEGRVDIATTTKAGRAVLWVANSGPRVPPDEVERLFQPFQRRGKERTDHGDGIGLGLSIVKAIATAHGASVAAEARLDGGLDIEVSFSSVGAADSHSPVKAFEPAARPPLLRRRRKGTDANDLPTTEVGTAR